MGVLVQNTTEAGLEQNAASDNISMDKVARGSHDAKKARGIFRQYFQKEKEKHVEATTSHDTRRENRHMWTPPRYLRYLLLPREKGTLRIHCMSMTPSKKVRGLPSRTAITHSGSRSQVRGGAGPEA